MGARRPTRQAVPITEGDLWAAVEADEKVQLLLVVMWCSACRFAGAMTLTPQMVLPEPSGTHFVVCRHSNLNLG
ncbi:hypothetical protein DIPPA_11735 [Diplonema papillatum]|nr:hypothetical protein DIPPA_11735 [Diplonema papillatum]